MMVHDHKVPQQTKTIACFMAAFLKTEYYKCFVNILKSFSIPLFEKVFKFLGHRDPQRHKEPEDRMMDSWDIKESQTQKQSQ